MSNDATRAPAATFSLSPDCVLLDDDSLVHMMWQVTASEKNKKVLFFSNLDELRLIIPELDRKTPLYIDSHLGNGCRGETLALELLSLGFSELYIATGYTKEQLLPIPVEIRVVGKAPPWL